MPIDPALAETLRVVAEEGTLDAAARRLVMTPSAVSQRLKLLEQQLGQRLLVRARPVRLTEPGRVVVRFARSHALIEQEARAELGLEAQGEHPRIGIAVNSDSLATWFMPALARFGLHHDAQLELQREDQDETARLLTTGAAMAAVTSAASAPPGFRAVPLGSLVYVAVASPAWHRRWAGPDAQPGPPGPEVLARSPRIDYDAHDDLQATWLRGQGVTPASAPRHLVPSTHELATAVEAGLGWAMLFTRQAEPLLGRGALIPLGGDPVATPLFWQVARTPSPLLEALTEAVLTTAHRELEQDDDGDRRAPDKVEQRMSREEPRPADTLSPGRRHS
ncbi:ArgP/LysG family DNA-binding transcriptional regulator [Brachybacterium tyrofermentans]|uniref:ArgP/LysG family DNA-binding transcriptional regulator n=1 Tax=Brachybacterium tyrofermentans TaxID=47848 RepID=UPI000A1A6A42|nr:ArgP/LysG family DNA-binding transcriptional regulator [Brachybacterium tyrofermentans]SLN05243.1 putative transcriptional regulator, LysR family [Corynebacterium xerosis]